MKKILLTLGATASVATPLTAVIACDSKEPQTGTPTNQGGTTDTSVTKGGTTNTTAAAVPLDKKLSFQGTSICFEMDNVSLEDIANLIINNLGAIEANHGQFELMDNTNGHIESFTLPSGTKTVDKIIETIKTTIEPRHAVELVKKLTPESKKIIEDAIAGKPLYAGYAIPTSAVAAPKPTLAQSFLSVDNGKKWAEGLKNLWEFIRWKNSAQKEQGVDLIAGKNELDLANAIKDNFTLLDDLFNKDIIVWDEVQKTYDASGKSAGTSDTTIADMKLTLITNAHDTIKNKLDNEGPANITGADLLDLAFQMHLLYNKQLPLIALSYGTTAQDFMIEALKGQTFNGKAIDDQASYQEYTKTALDTLLSNDM